jgi:folate-binding protein YgfZ
MTGTTLCDRAVIRLSGEDVHGFLQGLVTQDVRQVAPDAPRWSGLLSPQGKALFDFVLWAEGDDLLIDCEAAQAEALVRRLTLYRLRRPIAIARDPALAVHWSKAGEAGVPDPRLAALGRRWLAAADGCVEGWHAHRLSLGVPEGVADLGQDQILWLEVNAAELNGVSFTKGCYVGQENTARMNYRQKVNRRLVVVDGPDGPRFERRRVEELDPAALPDWLAGALA